MIVIILKINHNPLVDSSYMNPTQTHVTSMKPKKEGFSASTLYLKGQNVSLLFGTVSAKSKATLDGQVRQIQVSLYPSALNTKPLKDDPLHIKA